MKKNLTSLLIVGLVIILAIGYVYSEEKKKQEKLLLQIETFNIAILHTVQAQERLWGMKKRTVPNLSDNEYYSIIRTVALGIAKTDGYKFRVKKEISKKK